jgi:hypothetical protein
MSSQSSSSTQEFSRQDLFLTDESPQMPFDEDKYPEGVHYGHLKLLMSDLAALVYFWNPEEHPNPVMVVAGGAPGNHYVSILRMFPSIELHLYDSGTFIFDKPFGRQYKEEFAGRVHIHSEWFNDSTADEWSQEKWKKRGVIFTSDIRSVSHEDVSPDAYYEAIVSDNRNQEHWVRTIDPIFAVLKFKVPIRRLSSGREEEKNTPYLGLDGYVMRGIWGRPRTTECRLIPIKGADGNYAERVWDGIKFRDRNMSYNYTKRVPNAYSNIFTGDQTELLEGDLINDYDSAATVFVLRDYLLKCGFKDPKVNDVILLYKGLVSTLQDIKNTNLTVAELRKTKWRSTAKPKDEDIEEYYEKWEFEVEDDIKFLNSLGRERKKTGRLQSLAEQKSKAPAKGLKQKKDANEGDKKAQQRLKAAAAKSKRVKFEKSKAEKQKKDEDEE